MHVFLEMTKMNEFELNIPDEIFELMVKWYVDEYIRLLEIVPIYSKRDPGHWKIKVDTILNS